MRRDESNSHHHNSFTFIVHRYPTLLSPLQTTKTKTTFKMDAIVQAILNLSKLEVSLIKIEDATPEYACPRKSL